MEHFQIAIIGGGPGGYVAAIRAAQNGIKVVMIEKDWLGGTCLNIGCIPTKKLVRDAEIMHEIRNAHTRGIVTADARVDMPVVMREKERVVTQLTGGVSALLKQNKVEVIIGEAVVRGANCLVVDNEREIEFENLILAGGSVNAIPPIQGLDHPEILTSTEALALREVPESMAVIGGGVIGCEFAMIFAQFSTKVTVLEMMSEITPTMDRDVSRELKRAMIAAGISVNTGCKVTGVIRGGTDWTVNFEGKGSEALNVKAVLVSTGRRANLTGLDALDLLLQNEYIKTDEHMQTNLPGVYAIGDITGTIQLAHVASAQGITAADNIAGKPVAMRYDVVPSCVYTLPEIGSVGLTQAAAQDTFGDDVITGRFPMKACGKALAMGSSTGFTKLIARKSTGKLLGCHIIGPNATEIIGEAAAVMYFDGTLQDITKIIHAHPTVSESVMETAHLILDEPIHLPPKQ